MILVTGFASTSEGGPDPSGALLPLLTAGVHERADIRTLLLPTDPEKSLIKAIEALDRLLPDAVLSLGRSGSDTGLTVERIALNQDRSEGQPAGRADPIDAAGPAAYFSTLPVHAMLDRMQAGNVPAAMSDNAEGSLSNRLFYALLHYVALRGQETWFKRRPPAGLVSRIGLIRIPAPSRAGASKTKPRPTDLKVSVKGIALAIDAVVDFLASADFKTVEASPAGEP